MSQSRGTATRISVCDFKQQAFSVLMDGSVDKGEVENEALLIQYYHLDNDLEEVISCPRFLKLVEPRKADANGLVKCFGKGLQVTGVSDISNRELVLNVEGKPVIVSVGTDGGISQHIRSKRHEGYTPT